MRIPISWLNEYVNVSDLSVQELSDKLTFSGVEVEAIETDGPTLDEHFVVGEAVLLFQQLVRLHLHGTREEDVLDAEQLVATTDGLGTSSRDDGDVQTAHLSQTQRIAVLDVHRTDGFAIAALRDGLSTQHAIDVEHECAYLL